MHERHEEHDEKEDRERRSFKMKEPALGPDYESKAAEIVDAAVEVYRSLGPGFIESIYERALIHELNLRGLTVGRQVPISVQYKGLDIDGQRLDLIVEPGIILELKAVEGLAAIHAAQLLSYLRTTGMRLGLLINFSGRSLKGNIKRVIN